jgi:hypothetical protein
MICFYIKPSRDLFGINDFVQIQSSLYAHFTNYHLYRDCGQSRINLVMILYELILVPIWINLPVVRIVWCHKSYSHFKMILFWSDRISCFGKTQRCIWFAWLHYFQIGCEMICKTVWFQLCLLDYDGNRNRAYLSLYLVIGFWSYLILIGYGTVLLLFDLIMVTVKQSTPTPVSIESLLILFNWNDKIMWVISDSFLMFIKRKLDLILLKKISFDFYLVWYAILD